LKEAVLGARIEVPTIGGPVAVTVPKKSNTGSVSGDVAAENPAGAAQGDVDMIRVDELLEAISALKRSDLEAWIREEMVVPQQEAGTLLFGDMECARVRLICTLRYDLDIDTEALPMMLSLLDQLYDTRQRLLSLTAAVTAQDKDIQSAIIAAISGEMIEVYHKDNAGWHICASSLHGTPWHC
jgi:chaperone modulatory protein CbpM